jgi:hypothetical protein
MQLTSVGFLGSSGVVLGGVLNKRAATFWVLREVLPKS